MISGLSNSAIYDDVELSDHKGHSSVACFLNAGFYTVVQHLTSAGRQ